MLITRNIFYEKDGSIGYYESIFDSSNVLKTTYFPNAERLYISFNRGGTYSYGNITLEIFNEFENAESQGKFFLSKIKKNPEKYPYRKEFTLYPTEISELKNIVETHNKNLEKE